MLHRLSTTTRNHQSFLRTARQLERLPHHLSASHSSTARLATYHTTNMSMAQNNPELDAQSRRPKKLICKRNALSAQVA